MQKRSFMVACAALLLTTGRGWAMQEDTQGNDADCNQSYEQEACACVGSVCGSSMYLASNVDADNVHRGVRQESAFGPYKSAVDFCSVMMLVASLHYVVRTPAPDHSCLCGHCRKFLHIVSNGGLQAPEPMTMDEKKD